MSDRDGIAGADPTRNPSDAEPLALGHCPYCDAARGRAGGWGGSPDMFSAFQKAHDAGHPERTAAVVRYTHAEIDTMRALMPVLRMRRAALGRAIESIEYLRDTATVGEAARMAVEHIIATADASRGVHHE